MTIAGNPFKDPVDLRRKVPKPGDQLILSDEVDKYLNQAMREEVHDSGGVVTVDKSEDWAGIQVISVSCGTAKQEFLVKSDGSPAWQTAFYAAWPVFHWYYHPMENAGDEITVEELKRLNAVPSATNCAKCGHVLKDPGCGPAYKHCPVCEP